MPAGTEIKEPSSGETKAAIFTEAPAAYVPEPVPPITVRVYSVCGFAAKMASTVAFDDGIVKVVSSE